jgi:pimeloyl-ACP methyl ester carboxylesterase
MWLGFLLVLSACSEQNTIESENSPLANKTSSVPPVYGRDGEFSYPDFSGEYSVGSRSFVYADPYRLENFELNGIENRKLQVRFYYPKLNEDESPGSYKKLPVISETSWRYLVGHQEINSKKLKYSNYQNAKWNISLDSSVSNSQAEFPVLIFSHGYGYSAESYSALSAELASLGYIVVAINHTYGANPSDVGNKQKVWAKPLLKENIGAYLPVWSDDQIFVIDQLNKINSEPGNPFYQKLDLARLGVFGHSYGGAAAYHSASRDPRIKSIINIDGTIFNSDNIFVDQPFAFILSQRHKPTFNFNQAGDLQYKIRLTEFEHASFTDHILWWQWDHDEEELGFGKVEAYRAVELTTELVNDFFTNTLLSGDSTWLSGGITPNSEIQLELVQNKEA